MACFERMEQEAQDCVLSGRTWEAERSGRTSTAKGKWLTGRGRTAGQGDVCFKLPMRELQPLTMIGRSKQVKNAARGGFPSLTSGEMGLKRVPESMGRVHVGPSGDVGGCHHVLKKSDHAGMR